MIFHDRILALAEREIESSLIGVTKKFQMVIQVLCLEIELHVYINAGFLLGDECEYFFKA